MIHRIKKTRDTTTVSSLQMQPPGCRRSAVNMCYPGLQTRCQHPFIKQTRILLLTTFTAFIVNCA